MRGQVADIRQTYASRLLTEETTSANLQEVLLITQQLETFEGQGRLLIDLPAALSGQTAADYEVEDGIVTIPRSSDTVAVVRSTTTRYAYFQAGLSVEDYIALSAGVTKRSDQSAIYIVRANGSVTTLGLVGGVSAAEMQSLRPGDSIVVPVDCSTRSHLRGVK